MAAAAASSTDSPEDIAHALRVKELKDRISTYEKKYDVLQEKVGDPEGLLMYWKGRDDDIKRLYKNDFVVYAQSFATQLEETKVQIAEMKQELEKTEKALYPLGNDSVLVRVPWLHKAPVPFWVDQRLTSLLERLLPPEDIPNIKLEYYVGDASKPFSEFASKKIPVHPLEKTPYMLLFGIEDQNEADLSAEADEFCTMVSAKTAETLRLFGASGVGKTRVLLEAVSRRKGGFRDGTTIGPAMYFVCTGDAVAGTLGKNDGSRDFPFALQEAMRLSKAGFATDLDMHDVGGGVFTLLLLCRYFVYTYISKYVDNFTPLQWLLLQLFPTAYTTGKADIFLEVFKAALGPKPDKLDPGYFSPLKFVPFWEGFKEKSEGMAITAQMMTVLDESQVLVNQQGKYFTTLRELDHGKKNHKVPTTWVSPIKKASIVPHDSLPMALAGTGLSRHESNAAFGSEVLAPARKDVLYMSGFLDAAAVRLRIQAALPKLPDEDLPEYVCKWLQGRSRLVSNFILALLNADAGHKVVPVFESFKTLQLTPPPADSAPTDAANKTVMGTVHDVVRRESIRTELGIDGLPYGLQDGLRRVLTTLTLYRRYFNVVYSTDQKKGSNEVTLASPHSNDDAQKLVIKTGDRENIMQLVESGVALLNPKDKWPYLAEPLFLEALAEILLARNCILEWIKEVAESPSARGTRFEVLCMYLFKEIRVDDDSVTLQRRNVEVTSKKPDEASTAAQPDDQATPGKSNESGAAVQPGDQAISKKPGEAATAVQPGDQAISKKPGEAATAKQPNDSPFVSVRLEWVDSSAQVGETSAMVIEGSAEGKGPPTKGGRTDQKSGNQADASGSPISPPAAQPASTMQPTAATSPASATQPAKRKSFPLETENQAAKRPCGSTRSSTKMSSLSAKCLMEITWRLPDHSAIGILGEKERESRRLYQWMSDWIKKPDSTDLTPYFWPDPMTGPDLVFVLLNEDKSMCTFVIMQCKARAKVDFPDAMNTTDPETFYKQSGELRESFWNLSAPDMKRIVEATAELEKCGLTKGKKIQLEKEVDNEVEKAQATLLDTNVDAAIRRSLLCNLVRWALRNTPVFRIVVSFPADWDGKHLNVEYRPSLLPEEHPLADITMALTGKHGLGVLLEEEFRRVLTSVAHPIEVPNATAPAANEAAAASSMELG